MRIDEIGTAQNSSISTSTKLQNAKGKCCLLRHDVDMSPEGALKLGKMEFDKGVVSNFFFQLNSATYQFLSQKCIGICKDLQSMGHVVGLHVDSTLFKEDEDNILETINWIRHSLFPMEYAVSFHRPAKDTLGKFYIGVVSAYSEDLFKTDFYASDSRGEDFFYEKLEHILDSNTPFFQLLLHPCWWECQTDKAKIREYLKIRYSDYIDDYLLDNFPKVFRNIITEAHGNV